MANDNHREQPLLTQPAAGQTYNIMVTGPGMTNNGMNRKKLDSVVSDKPQYKEPKKSVAQRLSGLAFGEETDNPGKYILDNYLAPTGKRVANDIVERTLVTLKHMFQRWIWQGKVLDDNNGRLVSRIDYNAISSRKQEPVRASVMMSPVKDIKFNTWNDAQRVLDELRDTIRTEDSVTVRQYYEASDLPELIESGTSSSSGWTNLDKVEIRDHPDGDGFYLNLPRPTGLRMRTNG